MRGIGVLIRPLGTVPPEKLGLGFTNHDIWESG